MASCRGSAENTAFACVGFSVADPMYYQYTLVAEGGCGHDPGDVLYTFRATGDLDGDGSVYSTFELAAGASEANELYRTPGMYIENELE